MVLREFVNPPEKYGEVSFFWWHGDKIEKEKLHWILEQLKDKGIAGIQLNYCHSDKGGLQYGLTMDSDPRPFTSEWWELLGWLLEECRKDHMAFSLSDYTLGAPGQGSYMDRVLAGHPEFGGQKLEWRNGRVEIVKVPYSANPMAKGIGEAVADEFYGAFERHFPGECGKHINFFFSDELNFNIRGNLWCGDFREEFRKRKGYDITEKWEAIFQDIGPETPKIRLDYYDVIVALSEEAYFKPVYEWHESRGMTFGCDHGGRGQDVTEFGDYFRTMKWNQGPGNDQPRLASNIIKSKVSASIAHLYHRPRVWLEGFYSSGWQTSCADVADAVFRNFGLGHNLLSLHGLYYSTHGSMWEWAPPCNHYHMPYWNEMGTLLECTKRLSYFLAQGVHRCDAAIIYPVAAMEADEEQGKASVAMAFDMGRCLYQNGIDFDFIDFESVQRAEVRNNRLCVSGEEYRYLILPDMKNVRFGMFQALVRFAEAGGTVLVLGDLPEGSDRMGRQDPLLDELCGVLKEKGKIFADAEAAEVYICQQGDLDLETGIKEVFYQHRVIDGRDCYYLYGVEKGKECRFRASGIPVLLNPWSGKRMRIADFDTDGCTTRLRFPLTKKEPVLLVFEEDCPETEVLPVFDKTPETRLDLRGDWECEIIPTMDNQYGDYRLPAEEAFIGPEAREALYCITEEDMTENKAAGRWRSEWLSYGEYFWICQGHEAQEKEFARMENPVKGFEPSVVSMKYGVKGDAGYQGSYHGLKGKLSDEFITLGKKRLTFAGSSSVYEGEGCYYVFFIFYGEKEMTVHMETGELKPCSVWVNHVKVTEEEVLLQEGSNYVLLKYDRSGRTFFTLLKKNGFVQERPLVTKWYQNSDIIPFDPHPDYAGKLCWYRFTAPPGMKGVRLSTVGDTHVYIDKEELKAENGVYFCREPYPGSAEVLVSIRQERGCYGCNAFLEPVGFVLGKGILQLPLEREKEGLRFYSGGIRLCKDVDIIKKEHMKLCTGSLGSAVAVYINGKKALSLVADPYEGDITDFLQDGRNRIELVCYNTLYNHMLTIPTNYNYEKSPDWRLDI